MMSTTIRFLLCLAIVLLSFCSCTTTKNNCRHDHDYYGNHDKNNNDSSSSSAAQQQQQQQHAALKQILHNIRSWTWTTTTTTTTTSSHPRPTHRRKKKRKQREHQQENRTTKNHTLTFSLPCLYDYDDDSHHNNVNDNDDNDFSTILIQESTASLLAAKVMAKTVLPTSSTTTTSSSKSTDSDSSLDSLAWDILDAVLFPNEEFNNNDDDDDGDGEKIMNDFQSQGLLPKYWYFVNNNKETTTTNATTKKKYLKGTKFPHWSLFNLADHDKNDNNGTITTTATAKTIQSSQRLSAYPLHASLLWDMLLAVIPPDPSPSRQPTTTSSSSSPYSYNYEQNKDWWDRIDRYFQRIYQHHYYIHEIVMRGCNKGRRKPTTNNNNPMTQSSIMESSSSGVAPCYNILHPWESLMDPTSTSLWQTPLRNILQRIQQENWKLPFVIPSQVKNSYDFPNNEIYNAMMYLFLEGWNQVNMTKVCSKHNDTTHNNVDTADDDDDRNNNNPCFEEALFNKTKFALLDVGYAAVLSQSDSDLAQLGWVLRQVIPDSSSSSSSDDYSHSKKRLDQQLQLLEQWKSDNEYILQKVLWHPTHYTYLSRYYSMETDQMEWIEEAVSNNLIPFWNSASYSVTSDEEEDNNNNNNNNKNRRRSFVKGGRRGRDINDDDDYNNQMRQLAQEHMQDLSLQFLKREGFASFDCGPYPVWSHGGCDQIMMMRNNDTATTSTTTNSTIIKIHPLVNYLIGNGLLRGEKFETFGHFVAGQSLELFFGRDDVFGEAYRAVNPYDNLANLDPCGQTSTITAAVVYNFDVPDPAHANRLPLPPIRESWVITLITFELLVAFSIGVSCLILSFDLVRKLRVYTPIPPTATTMMMDGEDDPNYNELREDEDDDNDGGSGTLLRYDSTGTSSPDRSS